MGNLNWKVDPGFCFAKKQFVLLLFWFSLAILLLLFWFCFAFELFLAWPDHGLSMVCCCPSTVYTKQTQKQTSIRMNSEQKTEICNWCRVVILSAGRNQVRKESAAGRLRNFSANLRSRPLAFPVKTRRNYQK